MACRVCGAEGGVEYRSRSRMALCGACHKGTPAKVGREEFDRLYWDGDESVPESTRREFYDDYRTSTHGSVRDYIAATVREA
jgi:hypothetical protein